MKASVKSRFKPRKAETDSLNEGVREDDWTTVLRLRGKVAAKHRETSESLKLENAFEALYFCMCSIFTEILERGQLLANQ